MKGKIRHVAKRLHIHTYIHPSYESYDCVVTFRTFCRLAFLFTYSLYRKQMEVYGLVLILVQQWYIAANFFMSATFGPLERFSSLPNANFIQKHSGIYEAVIATHLRHTSGLPNIFYGSLDNNMLYYNY